MNSPNASGDMVSVLYLLNTRGYNEYHILTIAAVEPGDTLRFQLPGDPPQPTTLGTINVSASGAPPAGTTEQWFTVGNWGSYTQPGSASPYPHTVYDNQVGSDGNVDLLGWARDTSQVLGFAVHTDLDAAGDAVTLGTWDESPLGLTVNFINPTKGYTDLRPYRDGVSFYLAQGLEPWLQDTLDQWMKCHPNWHR